MKKIILLIFIIASLIGITIYLLPNFKYADFYETNNLNKNEINIIVDYEFLTLEHYPKLKDDELYLPFSFVKQYIDQYIYYDKSLGKVIVTTDDTVIRFASDDLTYYVNDTPLKLNLPIYIIDSEAYLPLSLIETLYQKDITYNSNTNIVSMNTKNYFLYYVNKANLRYEPNKKSFKADSLKNQEVIVFPNDKNYTINDEYTYVKTKDGLVGYVKSKTLDLKEEVSPVASITDYELPELDKVVMSWDLVTNFQSNSNANRKVKHKGLDVLSPTWFSFNKENYDLISIADKSYVNFAHKNGYQVWALVTDNFDPTVSNAVLSNSDLREQTIKKLLAYLTVYDLDGINIDFEAVRSKDKENYLQFFRELYPYMKKQGKILSVDMFVPSPWSMYYNREEVAKSVDYVCIMAYDEHYRGSPTSGPVASIGFVDKAIRDTLKEVPKEKILLGLPFYTRTWREVTKNGQVNLTVRDYSMDTAMNIFRKNNAKITWDEKTGYYYGEYEKMEGNEKVVYKAWLEDKKSLEKKLKLYKKYNIQGVAIWQRTLVPNYMWKTVDQYVN